MKKTPKALLVLTACLFAISSAAGNYKMGNYDLLGSRSIPFFLEPDLTRSNVKSSGLEVKWFAPTDFPVSGVPVVYKGVSYVGTTNLGGSGSIYAFDAVSGAKKWSVPLPGGVVASPAHLQG